MGLPSLLLAPPLNSSKSTSLVFRPFSITLSKFVSCVFGRRPTRFDVCKLSRDTIRVVRVIDKRVREVEPSLGLRGGRSPMWNEEIVGGPMSKRVWGVRFPS